MWTSDDGQQSLADHRFQGGQKRLDPLGNVDNLDPHGKIFRQFQEPCRVQMAAAAITFHATHHRGAGDASLLAQPDDGCIQRLSVPLIGAVDVDRHAAWRPFRFSWEDSYCLGRDQARQGDGDTTPCPGSRRPRCRRRSPGRSTNFRHGPVYRSPTRMSRRSCIRRTIRCRTANTSLDASAEAAPG